MKSKKLSRLSRANKVRGKISIQKAVRLSVHKTSKHIYAQIIDETGAKTLMSSSTLDKSLRDKIKNGGNIDAAKLVGSDIAKKSSSLKLEKIAFDRSGFKYHGRIKALAEAARENGLNF